MSKNFSEYEAYAAFHLFGTPTEVVALQPLEDALYQFSSPSEIPLPPEFSGAMLIPCFVGADSFGVVPLDRADSLLIVQPDERAVGYFLIRKLGEKIVP